MTLTPSYSTLFSCLHNEAAPVGHLGRGTHYSVFRSVEWLDVVRYPLAQPQIHDFAVIWDEDHDERVIDVVEKIYMAGLLSPIQFIGERKGMLSVVLAAKFGCGHIGPEVDAYTRELQGLSEAHGDEWPVEIGTFDRHDMSAQGHQTNLPGIIADDYEAVFIYLKNIDRLWGLGTKNWRPRLIEAWAPPPFSINGLVMQPSS
jgi:hypothetical protein